MKTDVFNPGGRHGESEKWLGSKKGGVMGPNYKHCVLWVP